MPCVSCCLSMRACVCVCVFMMMPTLLFLRFFSPTSPFLPTSSSLPLPLKDRQRDRETERVREKKKKGKVQADEIQLPTTFPKKNPALSNLSPHTHTHTHTHTRTHTHTDSKQKCQRICCCLPSSTSVENSLPGGVASQVISDDVDVVRYP
jgi:hypothetical protein